MDPRNLSIEPAFSHGDINPNNIMGIEGREIAWIDLDAVCVGCRHHDLAATLVKILFYQDVSVFDAFFGGYFAADPESEDSWQREGLKWFVLVCAIEAVKWQSFTRSARPGNRRSPEEDRREQLREQLRWADTFFMMARKAIQSPSRPGASISEAIARISAEVSARNMGRV